MRDACVCACVGVAPGPERDSGYRFRTARGDDRATYKVYVDFGTRSYKRFPSRYIVYSLVELWFSPLANRNTQG